MLYCNTYSLLHQVLAPFFVYLGVVFFMPVICFTIISHDYFLPIFEITGPFTIVCNIVSLSDLCATLYCLVLRISFCSFPQVLSVLSVDVCVWLGVTAFVFFFCNKHIIVDFLFKFIWHNCSV